MSNHDEKDLLTQTLRERADGVGGGSLDLEPVRALPRPRFREQRDDAGKQEHEKQGTHGTAERTPQGRES